MKIFLSHRSRDKALVREFRGLLPSFLHVWIDEDSLSWGDKIPDQLKLSIQEEIDFIIFFLDGMSFQSPWIKRELEWALEREKTLNRTFILPVLLEDVHAESLPDGFSERIQLRLGDFSRHSIEALADRATLQLFSLVLDGYSNYRRDKGVEESLSALMDSLTATQARLLGFVIERLNKDSELPQHEIENEMGYSRTSAELFYRLDTLIAQGFLVKRRITSDGQFSYRLSERFKKECF